MDHLPLPERCISEAIVKVPYLGLARYDNKGFYDYLQREGIREAEMIDFGYQDDRSDLRLSYLQEWLFFGSLHEFSDFSGVPLDLSSFVVTEQQNSRWITMRPLVEFASRLVYSHARSYPPANWSLQVPSEPWSAILMHRPILVVATLTQRFGIPERIQIERRRKLGELLMKVKSLPIWQIGPNQPSTQKQRHILWLIGVLLESIHYISQLCYGAQPETPPHLDLEYAFHDMRSRGWCPSRLSDKMSYISGAARYMLSLLPSFDSRKHERCTKIKCFDTPLALTRPNIGHVEQTCRDSCVMACVDETEVVEILVQGDYPLIKISLDPAGTFCLSAIPARTASEYVAISHVWAHGLGNPHRNGIPTCQVRKLKRLIEVVSGAGTLLWLDTLCVPVSAHYRKYRKLALFKMRQSYLNAFKVLVIDSSLQKVGSSIYERRLQVSCKNLLFQFEQGTAALSDLVTDSTMAKPSRTASNDDFLGGWSEIWHSLELQTTDLLRTHFPRFSTDENSLLVLVRTLHRRTTTKIEDEPICLATLTNISLEQFDGRPTLAQVLKATENVPESLVFIPGPRMTSAGFRWAPQSFLQQRPSQIGQSRAAIEENNTMGVLTDHGMRIIKPSIDLEPGFRIDTDFIGFAPLGIQTQHHLYKIRASTFLEDSSPQLLPRSLRTAAIIFERTELITDLIHAVLVSNVNEEGDVKYCHYELALALSIPSESTSTTISTFVKGTYHAPEF